MAGCAYYRCVLPAMIMDRYFKTQSFVSEFPSEDDIKSVDVLIQQRSTGRYMENLDICKKNNIPFIFETDDNDYVIPNDNEMGRIYAKNDWLIKQKEVLRKADTVMVSTQPLKESLSKYNNNIYVMPNAIDLSLDVWNLPKKKYKHLEIMWAGGSTHVNDLGIIAGAIPIRSSPEPKIIFTLAGYDIRVHSFETIIKEGKKVTLSTLNENFRNNVWVTYINFFSHAFERGLMRILPTKDLANYPSHYTYGDIGVAPLVNNRFNECKSNLKFLEFAAYRIPAVYSDIRPYSDTVEHGVDGFLVRKTKDWIKCLELLIEDERLRKEMGENARKKLERDFDIKKIAEKRLNLYKKLKEEKDGHKR